MKYHYLITFILITPLVYAQNLKTSPSTAYDSTELVSLNARRQKSVDFFELTKRIALPTTISFLGTDYHQTINQNLDKKNFLLNAEIKTPIPLGGKRWYWGNKGKEWYSALHIVPQFTVRIFNDDAVVGDSSYPVRTPSYLPHITYYGSHAKLLKEKSSTGFFLTALHHSNGQDGPVFLTNDLGVNYLKKGQINVYNGNFSEDVVVELGLINQRFCKDFNIKNSRFYKLENQRARLNQNKGRAIFSSAAVAQIKTLSRLGVEFHVSYPDEFKIMGLYGSNRLNFNLAGLFIPVTQEYFKINRNGKSLYQPAGSTSPKEKFRLELNSTFILDQNYNFLLANGSITPAGFKRRLNTKLTFYQRFAGTESSAFFVQAGYSGSDHYNIYFAQSAWFFRFGLAFLHFDYQAK